MQVKTERLESLNRTYMNSLGPFVVTVLDPTTLKTRAVAGPFGDIDDAVDRALRTRSKYPAMVDKASAFPPVSA